MRSMVEGASCVGSPLRLAALATSPAGGGGTAWQLARRRLYCHDRIVCLCIEASEGGSAPTTVFQVPVNFLQNQVEQAPVRGPIMWAMPL